MREFDTAYEKLARDRLEAVLQDRAIRDAEAQIRRLERKLLLDSISIVAMLGVVLAGILFLSACSLPSATHTKGVSSTDFREPTQAAVDIWNAFVGCEFLVAGGDIVIKSDDGAPCGSTLVTDHDTGSATSYVCLDGHKETLISLPGDVHTQTCTIVESIGVALGRAGPGTPSCGEMIRIRDRDARAIREEYCQ